MHLDAIISLAILHKVKSKKGQLSYSSIQPFPPTKKRQNHATSSRGKKSKTSTEGFRYREIATAISSCSQIVRRSLMILRTIGFSLPVSNDRHLDIIVLVAIVMHLFLDGLYCSYSSCICSPVSCCYCSVHSFVHLSHIVCFLCCSSGFLIVREFISGKHRQMIYFRRIIFGLVSFLLNCFAYRFQLNFIFLIKCSFINSVSK